MNIQNWIKNNTQTLKGKTIAVTGSTGGLGRCFCAHVAGLGANLVLLDRNKEKSEEHAKALIERFGVGVKTINVDMVDIDSVKAMCEKLKAQMVDIVVLNAGAYSLPRIKASTGFDQVFQINFVSPYYIVKELLTYLKKRNGRVVVVGSISHKFAKLNEKDVDFALEKAPRKVYGNAKRFLMFSLYKLFKNENDVFLSIAHPGITPTNITSHYPKFVSGLIKYPMKLVFTSPKKASLNVVKGVFVDCPYLTWIGPRIFNIWGRPKLKKLDTCKEKEQNKIFQIAERIYEDIKNRRGEIVKTHELGLREEYFNLVKKGIKIYEGRLNDEKRKQIEKGDLIVVKKDPERKESFMVKVVDKFEFDSFRTMAETLDSTQLGFAGRSVDEIVETYRKFYSKENESKLGVVAIKVEVEKD